MARMIIWPKVGDVIQLRSDFWVKYDGSLWHEMDEEEQLAFD